jgi:hypothetical protein
MGDAILLMGKRDARTLKGKVRMNANDTDLMHQMHNLIWERFPCLSFKFVNFA